MGKKQKVIIFLICIMSLSMLFCACSDTSSNSNSEPISNNTTVSDSNSAEEVIVPQTGSSDESSQNIDRVTFSADTIEYVPADQYIKYLFDTSQSVSGTITSHKLISEVYDDYPVFLENALIVTLKSRRSGNSYEFLFPTSDFFMYSYLPYSMNWSLLNDFDVTIFYRGDASSSCFSSTVLDQAPSHELDVTIPFYQSMKDHVLDVYQSNCSDKLIVTSEGALDRLADHLWFELSDKKTLSPGFYYYCNSNNALVCRSFNIGDGQYSISSGTLINVLVPGVSRKVKVPEDQEGIYYIFEHIDLNSEESSYYMVFANDMRIVKIE